MADYEGSDADKARLLLEIAGPAAWAAMRGETFTPRKRGDVGKTGIRVRIKGHEREYGLEELDVIVDAVGAEKNASEGGGLLGGGSSMLLMALLLGAGGGPPSPHLRGPIGPASAGPRDLDEDDLFNWIIAAHAETHGTVPGAAVEGVGAVTRCMCHEETLAELLAKAPGTAGRFKRWLAEG